jgi:HEAT repeat protein
LPARADFWGPPKKEHWSANGRFVLKVGWPQSDTLSLWEKTEDGLTQHWQRGYVDRVWPPHRAYVTDDGKYVVQRDVYHNLGYGKVIAILGPDGETLGSYELADFLPQDEIRIAEKTVSSICWNNSAWFGFTNWDREFALVTEMGTVRCFDLPTGKLLDLSDRKRAEIVGVVRRDAERWIENGKPYDCSRGITLLGALRITEAVPAAKKLFHKKTPTGSISRSGRPKATIYGPQAAAALALVRLIGAEAIPIIEKELSEANWYMKGKLIKALTQLDTKAKEIVETPHSEAAFEMWKRLAEHSSDDVRYPALCQVLRRDDGAYLLEHPGLIECGHDKVRGAAISLLSTMHSPQALPLLRKAITDKHLENRYWALQGLIARELPDMESVLEPYVDDSYAAIRLLVFDRLLRCRNQAAISKLKESIRSWPKTPEDDPDERRLSREFEILCRLVAELKLSSVKVELEGFRSTGTYRLDIPATGALAALGDEQALEDLHRFAEKGESRQRALALEMCGYVADEASIRLLRQAVEDSDAQVSHAAKRALHRIEAKSGQEIDRYPPSPPAPPPAPPA